MGVDLPVPDYTRICRRGKTLALPTNLAPGSRPRHLVMDSTGFKVYGEVNGILERMASLSAVDGKSFMLVFARKRKR